jgi:hypothetical protein
MLIALNTKENSPLGTGLGVGVRIQTLITVGGTVALLAFASLASAGQQLTGHVRPEFAARPVVEGVPAGQTMRLAIGLPLRPTLQALFKVAILR